MIAALDSASSSPREVIIGPKGSGDSKEAESTGQAELLQLDYLHEDERGSGLLSRDESASGLSCRSLASSEAGVVVNRFKDGRCHECLLSETRRSSHEALSTEITW